VGRFTHWTPPPRSEQEANYKVRDRAWQAGKQCKSGPRPDGPKKRPGGPEPAAPKGGAARRETALRRETRGRKKAAALYVSNGAAAFL